MGLEREREGRERTWEVGSQDLEVDELGVADDGEEELESGGGGWLVIVRVKVDVLLPVKMHGDGGSGGHQAGKPRTFTVSGLWDNVLYGPPRGSISVSTRDCQ